MLKFAFAALAALSVSSAALAGDGVPVSFRYQPHELETAGGLAALYERMELRARSSCNPHGDRIWRERDACVSELIDQWVAAIGDSRLAALRDAEAKRA